MPALPHNHPPILRVRLLGGFDVQVGDRPAPGEIWRRRRKVAAVVKLLALEPRGLHQEQLADQLWPDADPASARHSLDQALHVARRAIEAGGGPGPWLRTRGGTVVLAPPQQLWVDAHAFRAAALRARATGAWDDYQRAAALYTGELLPEDRYDDWAERRRRGLRAEYLRLLDETARRCEERAEPDRAIAVLEQLLEADPTDEDATARLMGLLALAGRAREALRRYAALEAALAGSAGAEPAAPTRALRDQIAAGGLAPPSQPGPALDRRTVHLPQPATRLIGREVEIAEVAAALAEARLVTLTGAGGTGKTRLAIAAATHVADRFADGTVFVGLAALRDPALVAPTIADALGLVPAVDRVVEQVAHHLAGRETLLVLDNLEQVLGAAVDLSDLVARCPRLRVLATSRAPLRVYGERELLVPPLALPDEAATSPEAFARSPAVQLFTSRADAARPLGGAGGRFVLTPANAATVAEICRKLDGLPLAIELAAARLRVLTPEALLARLRDGGALPLLAGGPRDLPARQRTMRDAVAWSHELLDPADQVLFRRVAVFVGGFTLGAAEAVCGGGGLDVLAGLDALLTQSLLRRADVDEAPRLSMFETIRQLAEERLAASGEEPALRAAHAACFLGLAEAAQVGVDGPEHRAWMDRLAAEHDNLRAAMEWAAEHDPATGLRIAVALYDFWIERGHVREGRDRVELLIARARAAAAAPPLLAGALRMAGSMALKHDDHPTARARFEECLTLRRQLGDEHGQISALAGLALAAWHAGADATPYVDAAIELLDRLPPDGPSHPSLGELAEASRAAGQLDRSRRLHEENVRRSRGRRRPRRRLLAAPDRSPGADRRRLRAGRPAGGRVPADGVGPGRQGLPYARDRAARAGRERPARGSAGDAPVRRGEPAALRDRDHAAEVGTRRAGGGRGRDPGPARPGRGRRAVARRSGDPARGAGRGRASHPHQPTARR
jgi:predicted ATPase/DNA-binding SARP family transcriptional activator